MTSKVCLLLASQRKRSINSSRGLRLYPNSTKSQLPWNFSRSIRAQNTSFQKTSNRTEILENEVVYNNKSPAISRERECLGAFQIAGVLAGKSRRSNHYAAPSLWGGSNVNRYARSHHGRRTGPGRWPYRDEFTWMRQGRITNWMDHAAYRGANDYKYAGILQDPTRPGFPYAPNIRNLWRLGLRRNSE